ncbi:MAG: ATP-binding protein [Coriobacteriia bacterium]|nr:ATP-binding protein [Coriobacteriia bacterium]
MKRDAMARLLKWKANKNRKPLILNGARQVGKTWLLEEFGRINYKNVAYVLLSDNHRMERLFESTNDAKALITGLEAEVGFSIHPEDTLIVLDEIQEVPKALSSLKYFCEQASEYHIAVAGSLLGLALHKEVSFPVGKVDSVNLYPMTFSEFTRAVKSDHFAEILAGDNPETTSSFHSSFIELLRQYLFLGGMPEVVQSFTNDGDYHKARSIQKQILLDYERDYSKHAPVNVVPRIRMVWNSMPSQLARENKKFLYGVIKKGARAKDFELAIQWLVDAGLILRIQRVNKVAAPLKHYEDPSAFKLFTLDVGLLGALSNLDPRLVLEEDKVLTEFKGAYTEQYVAQQLVASSLSLFYFSSDDAKVELDFVIEVDGVPIPIEVKSATNLHSKSLTHFVNKYRIGKAIKFSMRERKQSGAIINEPLYRAEYVEHLAGGDQSEYV